MTSDLLTTASPGDVVAELAVEPISRTTLALFAGASGDHNPIHIDVDVARSAGLDDVFAHGMLSMAYLGRLLTDLVPQDRICTFYVRFNAITPVLAAPICTATLQGRSNVAGEDRADLDLQVRLGDGTVTLTGSASIALR